MDPLLVGSRRSMAPPLLRVTPTRRRPRPWPPPPFPPLFWPPPRTRRPSPPSWIAGKGSPGLESDDDHQAHQTEATASHHQACRRSSHTRRRRTRRTRQLTCRQDRIKPRDSPGKETTQPQEKGTILIQETKSDDAFHEAKVHQYHTRSFGFWSLE